MESPAWSDGNGTATPPGSRGSRSSPAERPRARARGSLYRHDLPRPKDNFVFNAATIWWADGLSEPPGYIRPAVYTRPQGPDKRVQQITQEPARPHAKRVMERQACGPVLGDRALSFRSARRAWMVTRSYSSTATADYPAGRPDCRRSTGLQASCSPDGEFPLIVSLTGFFNANGVLGMRVTVSGLAADTPRCSL